MSRVCDFSFSNSVDNALWEWDCSSKNMMTVMKLIKQAIYC